MAEQVFRVIPGRPCNSCGGRTFLATYGPKKPTVRVCDSVTVVAELRSRLAAILEEIAKLEKGLEDAVNAVMKFQTVVMTGGADLLKVLGLKKDAKPEAIKTAIEKNRQNLGKAVEAAAETAKAVPGKQKEAEEVSRRLVVTNEFCQAVYGWRDDRIVRPPTQVVAAL